MDASDHGKLVLGAIFGHKDVRLLDYVSQRISAEHFDDRVQAILFTMAQQYADQTRGLLPRHALEDVLRSRQPGTSAMYLEYYDMVAELRPTAPDFRHSVSMLREYKSERETGEAIAQGMEILRSGARDSRGDELRGHSDARAHIIAAFADIERASSLGTSPEGDIRLEMPKLHARYAKARERRMSGQAAGIATGIERLDEALSGGLNNGEFALIAGFSSAGKSQFVAHLAWHASVMQGKNVVLFSSETTRDNMEVRIVGRHSRHPKFALPHGLNTRDIRSGGLSPEDYKAFQAVIKDYRDAPYGKCYIVQMPRGATMSAVETRLAAVSRQFSPDLAIIDYLALLRPERHGRERRDDLTTLLQDAKQLAVTFSDGRGIPLVSPWQVSREGRKEVYKRGGYIFNDLADTSEAERSPDIILSLLDPETDDSRGRKVHEVLEVMKNRENERFVKIELTADFANSYFAVRDSAADESLLNPLMGEEEE